MFDTSEEANQKLRHSVVLYGKDPVFIQLSEGNKKNVILHFNKLGSSSTEQKNIWEDQWNFRDLGPHLGYFNLSGNHKEAIYLSRMPVRQCSSTQGLCQRNVHIPPLRGSAVLGLPSGNQLSFNAIVNLKPFAEMLRGEYPTFNDLSKEMAKHKALVSKAFNREFAIRKADVGPFYLQYKGKDVGHSDDMYRWKVAKQFEYLQETMEHINLKVA